MSKTQQKINEKVIKTLLLVSLIGVFSFQTASFKQSQVKYKRVKAAYDKKWEGLQKLLKEKGISSGNFEILIRSFKMEKQLEVWCRNKGVKKYTLVKTIAVCASSGSVGPKRREGDGQVPEGFYQIASFNPVSSYHLALKVSYPNQSDRIKAKGRPGGDIMIHGNCVTIGCIPLEDEPIEELYVLCVESKNNANNIRVSIYPCRLNQQNFDMISTNDDKEKVKFWTSLKEAYQFFEENRYEPVINITKEGDYQVKK